jgi:Protein of unknown function (DUF3179)
MKKLFYPVVLLWLLFEIANVYFIMPMPGSQQMDSIQLAYFLHSWRWLFRILFLVLLVFSFSAAWRKRKWLLILSLLILGAVVYATNGPMTAGNMFRPIGQMTFAGEMENKINPEKLVIGVEINGEARAYPIQMIGYHHRVQDTVGGKIIFVTYCTVCRTGRVYEPVVKGKQESFRLVGMDHFNAMFEDKSTGSWWRQATGEACAGKLTGQQLPVVPNVQLTVKEWFRLYPQGKVLQWDPEFKEQYERMSKYDRGTSKSKLTGTDTGSWKEKSWVLGIDLGGVPHAYDWNLLKHRGWIADTIGGKTLLIMMHADTQSYSAWFVPTDISEFSKSPYYHKGLNILETNNFRFRYKGQIISNMAETEGRASKLEMQKAPVHQEFWHSWRTFHPGTVRYGFK